MGDYKFQVNWLRRTDNLGYEIGAWCSKSTEQENHAFRLLRPGMRNPQKIQSYCGLYAMRL